MCWSFCRPVLSPRFSREATQSNSNLQVRVTSFEVVSVNFRDTLYHIVFTVATFRGYYEISFQQIRTMNTTKPTPESPIKSISVREDESGARALHSKAGKRKYRCIANFYFTIECFVNFPNWKKYNGCILTVHRTDGVSM